MITRQTFFLTFVVSSGFYGEVIWGKNHDKDEEADFVVMDCGSTNGNEGEYMRVKDLAMSETERNLSNEPTSK